MSVGLIESLNQADLDLHVHLPGDAVFADLAGRFAVHPGLQANYVAAVRPGNAAAVQHAVAAAHRHGAGLLSVFNASDAGAQICGQGDSLILDLSRMDRVLEVDVANGFARVEPGVSYASLAAYLAEHGHALQVDSERDGGASISGSTFAKGFGYTPYGEHALVQCGAEFATPYGELVRTGMGAMPGSKTWQLYKYALGPYSDGLAMQSGLLVPTQIGVWLMGQVPMTRVLAYENADASALGAVVEALREFKIANLLPGAVSLTHGAFDAARHGVASHGGWRMATAFYGVPRLIELAQAAVGSALSGIAGLREVSADEQAASPVWQEQARLVSGQPGTGPVNFPALDGSKAASLTFVAPIEDRFAMEMQHLGTQICVSHDLPFLSEAAIVGRSMLQKVYLIYDAADPQSVERMSTCAMQLVETAAAQGIGLATQSFELSGLGLGRDDASGLAHLHRQIEMALTA